MLNKKVCRNCVSKARKVPLIVDDDDIFYYYQDIRTGIVFIRFDLFNKAWRKNWDICKIRYGLAWYNEGARREADYIPEHCPYKLEHVLTDSI